VRDFDPGELPGLADEDDEDEIVAGEDEDYQEFDSAGLDDPEALDDLDEFDELSVEGLFLHVTAMWSVLGAIDEDDRLTPLGWWGLPEAMQRAWTE
jgi:hypothetical protein